MGDLSVKVHPMHHDKIVGRRGSFGDPYEFEEHLDGGLPGRLTGPSPGNPRILASPKFGNAAAESWTSGAFHKSLA
jgi:hypothetical protein